MMETFSQIRVLVPVLCLLVSVVFGCGKPPDVSFEATENHVRVELLNVSYDPTRELWKDLNEAFRDHLAAAGRDVRIRQSHGGSASQARAVIDGLEADVVTLAMWSDTDQLRKRGLIKSGWETSLPNRSLPYTSTIVFVVRKGNPRNIRKWSDLIEDRVEVIVPSPRTSGNGKLAFLAAWGSVIHRGGSEEDARQFVTRLYHNVPVLDTAARGATTTFAQKGIGDVHLTWENEAHLEVTESRGELEIVFPEASILAEPHVAIVDANVDRKSTRAAAESYLKFLYTKEGQEIIARHFYRPTDPEVLRSHRGSFPELSLFPVTSVAASWEDAHRRFFEDGAEFDRIYAQNR